MDDDNDSDGEDRKEVDATLNQSYSNIESVVNRENGLALDEKEEDEGIFANIFDKVRSLMFARGSQHITTMLEKSSKIGCANSSSIHFQIMTSFTICRREKWNKLWWKIVLPFMPLARKLL